MVKILYYAVNGNGQGCVFISCPERDTHRNIWIGEMFGCYSTLAYQFESEGFELPHGMKWSDEPIKLKLSLEVCDE